MRIVGVDCAPTKPLAVFDGRDRRIPLSDARCFLNEIAAEPNVLLCWDSPLTGPPEAVLAGGDGYGSDFSQRPIEKFFSRQTTGFKTPKGIPVRYYCGCPHWAMSRSLIGLPRTGPFDAEPGALPFRLIVSNVAPETGRYVVEVHPALALWLWCRQVRPHGNWDYKDDPRVLAELWDSLLRIRDVDIKGIIGTGELPASDDALDARLAYALGRLWIEGRDAAILLGNLSQGTFLLPRVNGLETAFERFAAHG